MSEGWRGVGVKACGCTHTLQGLCVHGWAQAHKAQDVYIRTLEAENRELRREIGMEGKLCPVCQQVVVLSGTIVVEGDGRGRVYYHAPCYLERLKSQMEASDETEGERGEDGADEPQDEAAAREG